jgi:signal transduction histidine kinase/ActR/RegA family two-component response regulator
MQSQDVQHARTRMTGRPDAPPAPGRRPDIARLRYELAQQSLQLEREKWVRRFATMLGFAMGLIYLPLWVVAPLAIINLAADIAGGRIFRDPAWLAASAQRRAAVNALVCIIETTFVLPAGIMWHIEDPFAKSLAVGLAASAMMHLATVRAIHLPQGLWGGAALATVALASNSSYWILHGEWIALGLTTIGASTSLGYFLMAMISNHAVHRESAAGHRAAREADAAKDRLMATISHELRTPLNGILGLGHAALAEAGSPAARERLAILVSSAESLSIILDDILDISAARDGRLAIRPDVRVPAEEISATVLLFRHGIEHGSNGIALDLAPDLSLPARFDRQRLRQCLSNLLSNALRHGQGAAVRIRAARTASPGGGAMLDLTVADDGPGVPEALRALVFEPFARLYSPRPEGERQGQGLGLSIARSLARQMGGDIVLLPPGPLAKGAVFRLTLRLDPVPDGAVTTPTPTPQVPSGTPVRVLVVDDIATNRLVAVSCLRLAGAEAAEADSGTSALERLATDRFDVVCLDMNMPGLDGLATLSRIRALDGPNAKVRIIAMTADTGESKRAFYLAAGCNGYLAKPVTPERIAAALRATLPERPSGAA